MDGTGLSDRVGPLTAGRKSIVIVGLPRSGTTWVLHALGRSPGVRVVFEPDNEEQHPAAIHAKHLLGRYPVLAPGDHDRAYHRLWEWIFSGAYEGPRDRLALRMLKPGRRDRSFDRKPDLVTRAAAAVARDPRPTTRSATHSADQQVVAKSVHLQLALEWLTAEFDVEALVLLRHPANVLASWMAMNLRITQSSILETRPDVRSRYIDRWGVPLPGPDRIEQLSWRIGLLSAALEEALSRNPRLHVRRHETLCADPLNEFRKLFDELGLPWGPRADTYLQDHDAPGEGFTDFRVSSELAGAWESTVDDDQLATLRRVLGWFPITTWNDQDFERGRRDGA
jgi:hypothetical protein